MNRNNHRPYLCVHVAMHVASMATLIVKVSYLSSVSCLIELLNTLPNRKFFYRWKNWQKEFLTISFDFQVDRMPMLLRHAFTNVDWEEIWYSNIPHKAFRVDQWEYAIIQQKYSWADKSNMAVSVSRLRYHKLYQFVRLCNESGYSLSQVHPQRRSLSHTFCQMYSTSSPVKAKKWNQTGTNQHAHGFDKMQSPPRPHHLRDDLTSGSHSKDDKVSKEEEDPESDPETEDEEEPKRFSYRKLKSQKSGKGYLRPSRYMFREVEATGEEENLWERKNADINRKGKVNWYARQMLRLSQENKVRLCKDNSIFSLSVNYMCFFLLF